MKSPPPPPDISGGLTALLALALVVHFGAGTELRWSAALVFEALIAIVRLTGLPVLGIRPFGLVPLNAMVKMNYL